MRTFNIGNQYNYGTIVSDQETGLLPPTSFGHRLHQIRYPAFKCFKFNIPAYRIQRGFGPEFELFIAE
jgi:hypothetical protein